MLQGEDPIAPLRRTYDLLGCTFGIRAADPAVAGFLDPILSPLACPAPERCDWIASLSAVETIAEPANDRRIFEGALPDGMHAILVERGGERTLVVPDHFAMSFCRLERITEIRYVPGREGGLKGTAAFWMLGDLLAAQGRHLLHGAVLVDPTSDRTIAIFAPSGTGKTTTALALARSGLQFAGDDALVLDPGGPECRIWAMPRDLKVDRQAVERLPWLQPVLADAWESVEQVVKRDALPPLVALAAPRRRPVSLVVVLMPPNGAGHALNPIAKPEALIALASDNIRVAPGGVDPDNAAAMTALARLVATSRVIALSVGPDPGSLTPRLLGL